MVLLSFDEPLTRIAEHLVLVMTNLFAAPQLALNQEHLLIGREFQKLIRGNPSNNIREILGHAVIPDSEYLDDAGIVGQGIGLRAVNLQLPRILPEAPEREPPGPKQSCRREQRVYAPKVPHLITGHQCALLGTLLALRQKQNQAREPQPKQRTIGVKFEWRHNQIE